ncbi:hypothetical protein DUNSADRAFT_10422, partial [Dunaliella salina]
MELHHKLRRDPTWHKDACNLCGQLGHRASECTSGTVNWRQIYGDNAFILRPPVYWSEELAAKKARQPDAGILEKQAREYAKVCGCRPQGCALATMMQHDSAFSFPPRAA